MPPKKRKDRNYKTLTLTIGVTNGAWSDFEFLRVKLGASSYSNTVERMVQVLSTYYKEPLNEGADKALGRGRGLSEPHDGWTSEAPRGRV